MNQPFPKEPNRMNTCQPTKVITGPRKTAAIIITTVATALAVIVAIAWVFAQASEISEANERRQDRAEQEAKTFEPDDRPEQPVGTPCTHEGQFQDCGPVEELDDGTERFEVIDRYDFCRWENEMFDTDQVCGPLG